MINEVEIKNMIRGLAEYYGNISEQRISAYAADLREFDLELVKASLRALKDTTHTFPSISAIKSLIRANMSSESVSTIDHELEKQIGDENARLDAILKKINFNHNERRRWVAYWVKEVLGLNALNQAENIFDVGVMAFEKPAMFDLAEGNFKADKAIEIGRKKQEKIKKKQQRPITGGIKFKRPKK